MERSNEDERIDEYLFNLFVEANGAQRVEEVSAMDSVDDGEDGVPEESVQSADDDPGPDG